MGLVKAKMAFYHDSVGSRAHNEVFEVKNENVCANLENAGYVEKVTEEEVKSHQERQAQQEQVGQKNAQANEAVSMANHNHNISANQHTDNIRQFRAQKTVQPKQQAQQDNSAKAVRKNEK